MENDTLATQIHTHAMKRVLFNLTVLLLIAPERRTPSYAQPDSLATDSVQLYSQRHDASRGAFWFGIR